jgi:hypothetical protein
MATNTDLIQVTEFLEMEFKYELARFLRLNTYDYDRMIEELRGYKNAFPKEFGLYANHVLEHECTELCYEMCQEKKKKY